MKFYLLFLAMFHLALIASQNADKVKLDIDYVKSKYEKEYGGIKYLFYPAKNTKNLLIIFNGAIVNKYCMWSWFWDINEDWNTTAYLFLKDDSKFFYQNKIYEEIIKNTIYACNITEENAFSYGISMGAYAALDYGIKMGFKGTFTHDLFANNKNMLNELISIIMNAPKVPFIFMQYGNSIVDIENNEPIIKALSVSRKLFLILRKVDTEDHATCAPSKSLIEKTKEYFNNIFVSVNELCKLQNVAALPNIQYIEKE